MITVTFKFVVKDNKELCDLFDKVCDNVVPSFEMIHNSERQSTADEEQIYNEKVKGKELVKYNEDDVRLARKVMKNMNRRNKVKQVELRATYRRYS